MASASVDGAAFTEMRSDLARDPWFASDPLIEEIERIQYSLGEGPTLDAFRLGRPILLSDLAAPGVMNRWPMFAAGIAHLEVGGLFALPMRIGAITAGVCAVWRRQPGALTPEDLRLVLRGVDAATLALLSSRAGRAPEDDADASDGEITLPRRVHQATGMLVAQLGVDAETAFARLRAHAYLEGRTIHEVADEVVERRLRLPKDPP